MLNDKINNTELRELMGYISSQYSKEEIDFPSAVPKAGSVWPEP